MLPGQRVHVYRNLNKSTAGETVYSIRDAKTRRVLGHATNLLLNSCTFFVNQKGRDKVLREKRKNVHAWIDGHFGIIHAGDDYIFTQGYDVSYNPYKNNRFVMKMEEKLDAPIHTAGVVWIDGGLVIASGVTY